MLLGCIADDLTGATDLALMLTRAGMRTVQVMNPPEPGTQLDGFDAVVVALKTRTCPVKEAVALSLKSLDALLALGARQIIFKYCSTFDSTDAGNIGPVADALMHRLGTDFTIACPAFPANKRTIYLGHLFVDGQLLADSPMKDHPLTPMRDSNLVAVLQRQSQHKVGLIAFSTVAKGADAIGEAFVAARARGERYAIVDAVTDMNLYDIGSALADMKLITGGSGIALGLPANFVRRGLMKATPAPQAMAAPKGRAAIIAGSCSVATREQVAAAIAAGIPAIKLDPLALIGGTTSAAEIVTAAIAAPAQKPVMIYSSADPASVRGAQAELGRDRAGQFIEQAFADIARGLVQNGFSRLIVAGGETSGAVVHGLGISTLEIGPEIDPGVPWTRAVGHDLVLALKSGNFGARTFFLKAWEKLN